MKLLLSLLMSLALLGCSLPDPSVNEYAELRAVTWQISGEFGTCSAVQIAPHILLTAAHCDQPGLKAGFEEVRVLKKDEDKDLMLLWATNAHGASARVVQDMRPIPLDTKVVVVGYPLSLSKVVTEGRMQGPILEKDKRLASLFSVISAPSTFGNSGGPVFAKIDGEWRVIGLCSMTSVALVGGFIPNVVPHLNIITKSQSLRNFLGSVGR